MSNEELQKVFIDRLNDLLPAVDFVKLDKACNSDDNSYAKEILKQMHDMFVETYDTVYLDDDYEFVELPAVIRGRNTGHIGLGVVTLDLQASGEHWGTFFLAPSGVIDQGGEKMPPADWQYLKQTYLPYDYWYTVPIERDIHVDFDHVPEKINDMLNACYQDQPELKME